jgi:NitT/TauT family transport system ATP-binding protein
MPSPQLTGRNLLEVDNVEIAYGQSRAGKGHVAVRGMTFDVKEGEFVTVVGPSGSGKTTLLLAIDGLIKTTAGEVRVNGATVTGPGPDRAMVFQEFGLLPWRTTLANVMLGVELAKQDRTQGLARARELIKLVGLEGYEDRHPHELSGGMRQRVGLAPALAVEPDVLLMDEPFGALDAQTRELMGIELLRIWEVDRKTVIFVTHDVDEAIYLADRVIVVSRPPAHVAEIVEVDLPRPRDRNLRTNPAFMALRTHLAGLLFGEIEDVPALSGVVG